MTHRLATPLPLATGATPGARARALGKAALYLLIALVSAVLISSLLRAATGQQLQELMRAGAERALLAHAALLLALVVIPTAISLQLWKEPFATSGWLWAPDTGRLAILGLAAGAGLMAAIVAVLWLAGAWTPGLAPLEIGEGVRVASLGLALWLVQAAHEEGLHRGYAFVQLSRAISFWAAAAVLALWFAWGHVGNAGATSLSLLVAGMFALVLAWSLLRTGSLWFAWGFHGAWNFTQSSIFGLANSGGQGPASLMTAQLDGAPLLTGGTAGPEGSVLALLAIAALAAIVRFVLPAPARRVQPG